MSRVDTFNTFIAKKITDGVATMWCAYLFAAIALISLPTALQSGNTLVIISWITQTFLQLVLLSIIMVGQKVSSAKLEKNINETHDATLIELAELKLISAEIQQVIKNLEEKVK